MIKIIENIKKNYKLVIIVMISGILIGVILTKLSTHPQINTSTNQHINTSSNQHIITSTHQHIKSGHVQCILRSGWIIRVNARFAGWT